MSQDRSDLNPFATGPNTMSAEDANFNGQQEDVIGKTASVTNAQNGIEHIQLFEERLTTHKRRIKTGEVRISKQIVTSSESASVPVKKEKIIIEIESVYNADTRLDIGQAKVAEDGSMSMDIYEEQVSVCREVVPYQSVSVKKQVVNDVVEAEGVLRREELIIEREGNPVIEER